MSESTDLVVLKLAERLEQAEGHIGELLEAIQSMQRNLTNAFKEAGYDFAKIARVESSRRTEAVQNDTNVEAQPEDLDPAIQDEIAKRILAGTVTDSNAELIALQNEISSPEPRHQHNPDISRDVVNKASLKGSTTGGVIRQINEELE
jgi:hypothetical protein